MRLYNIVENSPGGGAFYRWLTILNLVKMVAAPNNWSSIELESVIDMKVRERLTIQELSIERVE